MYQPAPTRQTGLERLHAFLPNAGRNYARDRNCDFGPLERANISMLSGYIRHRLVLEEEVLDKVVARFSPTTAEKFIQEVFWRSYFKGWLEQHPTVWTAYREDVARRHEQLGADTTLARRYNKAVESNTGIDCFDNWGRELIETGYLHNHTRMWFASIWIFTLQLPWQLGADFFYRHLIDGDPASNTLSWRWVGGLHTKGKTYLARPSNIEKYTCNRFAPYGQLAASAPPLSEEAVHARQSIRQPDTDNPGDKTALLITEEECCPETLFSDLKPVAGLSLLATEARSSLPVGHQASAFARGAVNDATKRAVEHFGVHFSEPLEVSDWAATLTDFARADGVNSIVTAYAPVGPVAEKLAVAKLALAEHGISLSERRRDYDELAWPHATRGFFALKKKIPRVLEELQRRVAPTLL